jgi:nucleoside-diphosphate-sugar epimerase
VNLLNAPVTGIVNIAAGEAVSLGDVARVLGELTGKPRLLDIQQAQGTPQNPLVLTADTAKLSSLGFRAKYALRQGLESLLVRKESV